MFWVRTGIMNSRNKINSKKLNFFSKNYFKKFINFLVLKNLSEQGLFKKHVPKNHLSCMCKSNKVYAYTNR